jgi:hypothetical protein
MPGNTVMSADDGFDSHFWLDLVEIMLANPLPEVHLKVCFFKFSIARFQNQLGSVVLDNFVHVFSLDSSSLF